MTKSSIAAALLVSVTLGFGIGFAPAFAEDQPAAAAKSQSTSVEKSAIRKECIDQANAKGLHGKARKKFKRECKHKGGKME